MGAEFNMIHSIARQNHKSVSPALSPLSAKCEKEINNLKAKLPATNKREQIC